VTTATLKPSQTEGRRTKTEERKEEGRRKKVLKGRPAYKLGHPRNPTPSKNRKARG